MRGGTKNGGDEDLCLRFASFCLLNYLYIYVLEVK